MRQKSSYDMVLLRKIFAQNKMTSIEVGEMLGCCTRKASELRVELGFSVPKKLTCSYCGEEKTVNCFRSKFPEACIKCRVEMGLEKNHQKGGGNTPKIVIKIQKCHGCHQMYKARFNAKSGDKLDYYCKDCKEGNGEIEDYDEHILRFG